MSALNAQDFEREVSEAVARLNVAGLCDPAKRNWYGVDFQDVIDGAPKLELTADEVRRVIASASWARKTAAPLSAASH